MAVDEALFRDACERGIASLRFYEWQEPTLSLGYFQHYADRARHPPSRDCAVVRRQTGGGAILHDRELTYSLALPSHHPFARHNEQLYAAVHDAFIATLKAAPHGALLQASLERCERSSSLAAADEPFLCFQRRARSDVVVMPTSNGPPSGWKILGSAQRRHRGAILQHGSLLLAKSPCAPELPGVCDIAETTLSPRELAQAISVRLADAVDLSLSSTETSTQLRFSATQIAKQKYGTSAWTNRR